MTAPPIAQTTQPDFAQQWQSLRARLTLEWELRENPQRLNEVRRIIKQIQDARDGAVGMLLDLALTYDRVEFQSAKDLLLN